MLHIGVDADTGQIVASALTSREADDGAQVGPLLDQVAGPVASVTGDGAYDQDGVYTSVSRAPSRSGGHCAAARDSRAEPDAESEPTQRDRHLQLIAERGRMGVAASLRVQQTGSGRDRDQPVQARDRG